MTACICQGSGFRASLFLRNFKVMAFQIFCTIKDAFKKNLHFRRQYFVISSRNKWIMNVWMNWLHDKKIKLWNFQKKQFHWKWDEFYTHWYSRTAMAYIFISKIVRWSVSLPLVYIQICLIVSWSTSLHFCDWLLFWRVRLKMVSLFVLALYPDISLSAYNISYKNKNQVY